MAAVMKTPGVYIIEKNAFPNSVVEVATAVPAFIGYTEKADNKGKPLANVPWRISSMAEFLTYFGGPPQASFGLTSTDDPKLASVTVRDQKQKVAARYQVQRKEDPSQQYLLYCSMQLFFQNGGGPCYVVAVGSYHDGAISSKQLLSGIALLEKEQEPTMVVIPDAMRLDEPTCILVQQQALLHCGEKMKSRVAILDVYGGDQDNRDNQCITNFRGHLGINNLDFAAAYYPWVRTSIVADDDLGYGNVVEADLTAMLQAEGIQSLVDATNQVLNAAHLGAAFGVSDVTAFLDDSYTVTDTEKALAAVDPTVDADVENAAIDSIRGKADAAAFKADTKNAAAITKATTDTKAAIVAAKAKVKALAAKVVLTADETALAAIDPSKPADVKAAAIEAIRGAVDAKTFEADAGNAQAIADETTAITPKIAAARAKSAIAADPVKAIASIRAALANYTPDLLNKTLAQISDAFKQLRLEMKRQLNLLPPSAAIAGVYTMVDSSRGVWKAPANVSLNSVVEPAVSISNDDQETLNVDVQGKSINAIRSFIGEGVLVWGARTLDGNSLDWRYIGTRRTMIMLEQSIKLASKAYVFENNVSTTWVTIKAMIRNFLTGIWKQGGLAGATPDEAFAVFCGLGETMTADDILEGILRVTVLVAVTHPAEFIEITFQQQLQKS